MKLEGKTCLITGANSGLGFAAAKRFASLGAHVILVCRSKTRVDESIQSIREIVPTASLDGMEADLSNLLSVRNLVDQVNRKYSALDILFNNAAVMKMERTTTPDGFETMFQTNYLAPYILSTGLVELMKKRTPSQIINIAVPSEKVQINFDDMQFAQKFNSLEAFFQTKLYLLLFSLDLSKKLAGSGVGVNCLDPGPFRSNLSREAPGYFRLLLNLFGSSSDTASQFVQKLAEKTDQPGFTGKVFVKDKEKPLTDYWKDSAVHKRLLDSTESLISRISA
jgi:NAD(P)-dependent dehydrogenase (short-subunit alcohol dehydrogenase family)